MRSKRSRLCSPRETDLQYLAAQVLSGFTTNSNHSPASNDELSLASNLPAATAVTPQEVSILRAFLSEEIEALLSPGSGTDEEIST